MSDFTQRIWTIGGGKGGVGKSLLTASMAAVLAGMNRSVVAVDADLGSSNLHTYLGIKSPPHTLLDLLEGRATPEDVLLPTAEPNLRLLSCAHDILGIADPSTAKKESLIRFISELKAEYVLVDIGAGTSTSVLDFFNMSDEGIVVVSPDPASMQSAYVFIKSAVFRRIQRMFAGNFVVETALRNFAEKSAPYSSGTMLDFYEALSTADPRTAEKVAALVDECQPLVLLNMAGGDEEQRVAEILQSVSRRFLNLNLRFCGLIGLDSEVRRAVQRMSVLAFQKSESVAARQIREAVSRLLSKANASAESTSVPPPATPVMGLNDSLRFKGRELHIQTEDLGYTGKCITTQVFLNGRVIYSAKTEYPNAVLKAVDRASVVELMRKQHFNVMREIESRGGPAAAAETPAARNA